MADIQAQVRKTFTLDAVVYPKCKCGHSWAEHMSTDPNCAGYVPTTPVRNYGTVSFSSPDPIARFLWAIERRIKALRERRVRSL